MIQNHDMDVMTSTAAIIGMLIVCHMNMDLHAAPVGDSIHDNVVNWELNGNSLIAMGTTLDKPLLKLLGRTLETMVAVLTDDIDNKTRVVLDRLEETMVTMKQADERNEFMDSFCRLHLCTDWSEWTRCSTHVVDTFGAKTRSRTCGTNGFRLCTNVSNDSTTETDANVCEGLCPGNYTITTNGFCIRLYNTQRKTWNESQAECNECGGSLLNVDSEMKAKDVEDSLKKMSHTSTVWMDGTRLLPDGEWRYEYGGVQSTYTDWQNNEPNAKDDCIAYVCNANVNWSWYGRPCGDAYNFICEIV